MKIAEGVAFSKKGENSFYETWQDGRGPRYEAMVQILHQSAKGGCCSKQLKMHI